MGCAVPSIGRSKAVMPITLARIRPSSTTFYERMYAPFVNSRHNDLAMPTSHEDMSRFWLWRGGVGCT